MIILTVLKATMYTSFKISVLTLNKANHLPPMIYIFTSFSYTVLVLCHFNVYLTEVGVMCEAGYVYSIWQRLVPCIRQGMFTLFDRGWCHAWGRVCLLYLTEVGAMYEAGYVYSIWQRLVPCMRQGMFALFDRGWCHVWVRICLLYLTEVGAMYEAGYVYSIWQRLVPCMSQAMFTLFGAPCTIQGSRTEISHRLISLFGRYFLLMLVAFGGTYIFIRHW